MSQQITLEEAKNLIAKMKENPVEGLPVSETFDAATITSILQQQGCVSLRIYPGMKEDNSIAFVLSGADATGSDLTGFLGEDGFRCPPACPTGGPLSL